jgi:branched-chain amino acid transport system ATP-binding protein
MALLQLRDLHKRYGGLQATAGVSLEVAAGTVHALIGPNGAGKSTLIDLVSGMVAADAGSVTLAGHDLTALPAHARVARGLARSYQVTNLFKRFTALDSVALAVQAASGSSLRFWAPVQRERELFDRARQVLERVGLGARAEVPAGALAHGEQRQLEVALALATGARVLLLDEPMAGLGADESARMLELLRSLKGGPALLLVEHDMDAVFQLADTITVLDYGRVIASGTPEAIRTDPEVRRAYLGEEVVP